MSFAPPIQIGQKGDDGDAATVAVGTVTTGDAGSSATVTNVGTASAAVLDFAIPKGDKGDTGATGATGPAGADGADGVSFIGHTSTDAPTVNDDSDDGYAVGSCWRWVDGTGVVLALYVCLDATAGAAVWREQVLLNADGELVGPIIPETIDDVTTRKAVGSLVWVGTDPYSLGRGSRLSLSCGRAMLTTCLSLADEAVIWDGAKTAWDEAAPWWVATKTLLGTK